MEVISGKLIVSLHFSNSQCELILSNKFAILWNDVDWTWRYISLPWRSWSLNIQHKIACYVLFSWNSLHSSNCSPQKSGVWINPHFVKKSIANILWNYLLCLVFTKGLWQFCVLHLQLDLPRIAAIYSWCSLLNCSSILQPSLRKYLTNVILWVGLLGHCLFVFFNNERFH